MGGDHCWLVHGAEFGARRRAGYRLSGGVRGLDSVRVGELFGEIGADGVGAAVGGQRSGFVNVLVKDLVEEACVDLVLFDTGVVLKG